MWAFLQPSYPVFRVLWCISWCGVSSNQGWSDSNQSGTLPLTWIRGRSRSVRIQGVPSCSSSLKTPRTSLSGPKAVRTRTAPATPADRPSTSSRPPGPTDPLASRNPTPCSPCPIRKSLPSVSLSTGPVRLLDWGLLQPFGQLLDPLPHRQLLEPRFRYSLDSVVCPRDLPADGSGRVRIVS